MWLQTGNCVGLAVVWVVLCMHVTPVHADELDSELITAIRNGHQRLNEAASTSSGNIRRWRGMPQQGELSFSQTGFSSNLNAHFYVLRLSRRLDYFGDQDARELVSTILQTPEEAYRYVISGGGTGSPLAALYRYDSTKHVDISSAISTDLESPLFALSRLAGKPLLDYVQGAEISVKTTGDQVELGGVHKVGDSTVKFMFVLDRNRDYAVIASTLDSESPGVATHIESACELTPGNPASFVPAQMATRVQISMNGTLVPALSYEEITKIAHDTEQPSADIFSNEIFASFGREFAVISVRGDDTQVTEGAIVQSSEESPVSALPAANARSEKTNSLFLIVNGIALLMAALWLFFRHRRQTEGDSK